MNTKKVDDVIDDILIFHNGINESLSSVGFEEYSLEELLELKLSLANAYWNIKKSE